MKATPFKDLRFTWKVIRENDLMDLDPASILFIFTEVDSISEEEMREFGLPKDLVDHIDYLLPMQEERLDSEIEVVEELQFWEFYSKSDTDPYRGQAVFEDQSTRFVGLTSVKTLSDSLEKRKGLRLI